MCFRTNRRQRNSIGNFSHNGRGRAQSRRSDAITGIAVDDHRRNQVKRDINTLKQAKGLGEVAGVAQLGHQTEEGTVAAECKDNVAHCGESMVEICVGDSQHGIAGFLDSDGNHRDEDCRDDTHEGWKKRLANCKNILNEVTTYRREKAKTSSPTFEAESR